MVIASDVSSYSETQALSTEAGGSAGALGAGAQLARSVLLEYLLESRLQRA